MTPTLRSDDPVTDADTDELFKQYLRSSASDARLVEWVFEHITDSGLKLTDTVHSILTEALECLTRDELIEQIALNQPDHRSARGYHTWCLEEAEALAAGKARSEGLW